MRIAILVASAAVVSTAGGAANAQTSAPIVARAEQCLVDNVKRVVAIESDINAAASFLVDYACAMEMAGAARYERNLGYVNAAEAMSKAAKARSAEMTKSAASTMFDFSARVDPTTGDIVSPPASGAGEQPFLQSTLPSVSKQNEHMVPWAVPSSLRMLAGRLVLEAREKSGAAGRNVR